MPLTKSLPIVTEAVKTLLDTNANTLGLLGVFYGDENLIPDYPAATVHGGTKRRVIATTRQYDIFMPVQVILYFGKVDNLRLNTKESELLAESVEDLLHSDRKMGGLVINSFVTRMEPGQLVRQSEVVKATRITWEGRSREVF
jgi:hypothetical protein